MKFEITLTGTAEGHKIADLYSIPIETKLYFDRLVTLDENDIFELLDAESNKAPEELEVIKELVLEQNLFEEGLAFSIVETSSQDDDAVYDQLSDMASLTWDNAVRICEFLDAAEDEEQVTPAFLFAVDSYGSVYDAMEEAMSPRYRDNLSLFKIKGASDEEEAFAQYAEEYFSSCYDIPDYLENYIDWKKAGADMRSDCSIIEFNGDYWIARDI